MVLNGFDDGESSSDGGVTSLKRSHSLCFGGCDYKSLLVISKSSLLSRARNSILQSRKRPRAGIFRCVRLWSRDVYIKMTDAQGSLLLHLSRNA